MLKIIIIITVSVIISGCQSSENNPIDSTPEKEVTSIMQETSITSPNFKEDNQELNNDDMQEQSSNNNYSNVFGESVIGKDRYPETALDDSIPIMELRKAINEYFQESVKDEEKNNSEKELSMDTVNNLQMSLHNNKVLKPLKATVDQIIIPISGKDQYVIRIVVPMTPDEAAKIEDNNDILLLNEAHAHIGNRLVMIAYLDSKGEKLIPFHLNTSTYSLFSQSQ